MARSARFVVALVVGFLVIPGTAVSVAAVTSVTQIPIVDPGLVVVDPADRLVYIGTGSSAPGITVFDADSGAQVGRVALPNSPAIMALDPAGGGVFVYQRATNAIQRLDGSTLSLGAAFAPFAAPLTEVAYIVTDPGLNLLFAIAQDRPRFGPPHVQLVAVDLATKTQVDQASLARFGSLQIDPALGHLYVTDATSNITVYDTDLNAIDTIATSQRVDTMAVDSVRSRLYALGSNVGDSHTVVDTSTDTVIGSLPPSDSAPMRLAVDEVTGKVYVSYNSYPNPSHLAIYDAGAIVETVPMPGPQPSDLAVDTVTGNAWVIDQLGQMLLVAGTLETPPDADGDGTTDSVDADGGTGTSPAGAFLDDTGDGHTTAGEITDAGGMSFAVVDEPDPDGVRIGVGFGSGHVTLSTCSGFVVQLTAGTSAVVTCGSVTVQVITGSASIVLGGGLTVISVPADGAAKVADTGGGTYTVQNLGSTDVGVTVDGVTRPLAPGSTRPAAAWDFVGFSQPIDNLPVLNQVKAGQAIPIKWRILNATGVPVTSLQSATIAVSAMSCANGSGLDQIEETTADAVGLHNLGNGYYELVWKSPKTYASSCRTLHIDIGDGVLHDAGFQFTK